LCVANDDERARLLGSTAALAMALSLVLLMLMAIGIELTQADNILVPACLCYLCWQAQETLRRFLLADSRYRAAVAGDGVAYVGQSLLIAVLLRTDSVTLSSAIYVMSATFALGALVHALKLRFAWPDVPELRGLAREYISIGKWSVFNYQLVLVRGQLFLWLLAAMAGTAATASLQAGLNIANMMNPILFGIGNAIPQVAAHAYRSGGVLGASRAACGYVLFGLGPILVICAAGVLVPDLLLRSIYGSSSPYLAVVIGVQVLAVAGVLDYIAEMISKTLLGVESGKLAFLVNIVAAVAALVLALALIPRLGVLGACVALLIANSMRMIGAVIAIAWLISRERSQVRLAAVSSVASTNPVVDTPARQ
jgi:O-antigen/teichoic acid export membrane protein